jgi:hypothetical protein
MLKVRIEGDDAMVEANDSPFTGDDHAEVLGKTVAYALKKAIGLVDTRSGHVVLALAPLQKDLPREDRHIMQSLKTFAEAISRDD